MRYEDLPRRWKAKLQEYLVAKTNSNITNLGAADFPLDSVIRIRFEDDSNIEFKYAFVIEAPEFRELAVFTEHCGYHVFPLHDGVELTTESTSSN